MSTFGSSNSIWKEGQSKAEFLGIQGLLMRRVYVGFWLGYLTRKFDKDFQLWRVGLWVIDHNGETQWVNPKKGIMHEFKLDRESSGGYLISCEYLTMIFDDDIWKSYLKTIFDENIWPWKKSHVGFPGGESLLIRFGAGFPQILSSWPARIDWADTEERGVSR